MAFTLEVDKSFEDALLVKSDANNDFKAVLDDDLVLEDLSALGKRSGHDRKNLVEKDLKVSVKNDLLAFWALHEANKVCLVILLASLSDLVVILDRARLANKADSFTNASFLSLEAGLEEDTKQCEKESNVLEARLLIEREGVLTVNLFAE